jgi:hypothetical protein
MEQQPRLVVSQSLETPVPCLDDCLPSRCNGFADFLTQLSQLLLKGSAVACPVQGPLSARVSSPNRSIPPTTTRFNLDKATHVITDSVHMQGWPTIKERWERHSLHVVSVCLSMLFVLMDVADRLLEASMGNEISRPANPRSGKVLLTRARQAVFGNMHLRLRRASLCSSTAVGCSLT